VLYRREGFSKKALVAGGGALLFFIATILTYSKTAWLSMPLTVGLMALIGFKGRPRYALIGILAALCLFWASSDEFRTRILAAGRTFDDRVEIWGANADMIRKFPIFGVGWHRNSELSAAYYRSKNVTGFESHAHNNILDQWSSTGLFGLLGFIWWNIVVVVMCLRIYRRNHDLLWRSLGLGLVGGWFCLHLNGLTQANWWDAKVLHQIGWVTALTMETYRRSYNFGMVRSRAVR
jgi:O-antigen ligase